MILCISPEIASARRLYLLAYLAILALEAPHAPFRARNLRTIHLPWRFRMHVAVTRGEPALGAPHARHSPAAANPAQYRLRGVIADNEAVTLGVTQGRRGPARSKRTRWLGPASSPCPRPRLQRRPRDPTEREHHRPLRGAPHAHTPAGEHRLFPVH